MTTRSTRSSFPVLAAGILGLTGVALGAMGAHALKAALAERGMTQAWETAARYHLLHAVGTLAIAAWASAGPVVTPTGLLKGASWCWFIGVILFSGSLYWLALGGPRWLGPVTPLGGIVLMAGWLLVLIAAFAKPRVSASQTSQQTSDVA